MEYSRGFQIAAVPGARGGFYSENPCGLSTEIPPTLVHLIEALINSVHYTIYHTTITRVKVRQTLK